MRTLVLAALTFTLFFPVAAAQVNPASGVVTAEFRPPETVLKPGETGTAHAWINATIQCEDYTPRRVVFAPDPESLEDENGSRIWGIQPDEVEIPLENKGAERFEASELIAFVIAMEGAPRPFSSDVEFELRYAGTGFGSSDCTMWGATWRLDGDPRLTVKMDAPEPSAEPMGGDVSAGAEPFDPSTVIVTGGPVRGDSRVPSEAFWSLGIVFGLFAAGGAFGLRKQR